MSTRLAVVVPCYNEEDVFAETAQRLLAVVDKLQGDGLVDAESVLLFVDDGSRDRTWELIQEWSRSDQRVRGVKLSRNYGHQNALLAGLSVAKADAVVTIDADLQDDPAVIKDMIERYSNGCDIVYGVRKARDNDSVFKRGTARAYYRLLDLLGVEVVLEHADYRLMSQRTVQHLQQYSEVNLFLRGMIPLLGFRSAIVYYERAPRFAGESKYSLLRMLALAVTGLTSFSIAPLRFITLLGLCVFALSFVMVGWVMYGALVMDSVIPGWASSVIPIYFLGGIQLLSIGVLGEYVAKVYLETKRRPRYIIETEL